MQNADYKENTYGQAVKLLTEEVTEKIGHGSNKSDPG